MSRYHFAYDRTRRRANVTHRIIWEQAHGKLPRGHDIHHRNGNPKDNRIENLEKLPHRYHLRLHSGNFIRTNGQWLKRCSNCKRILPISSYYRHTGREIKATDCVKSECKLCSVKQAREYYQRRKEVIKNAG